jgi:hypothetical protein
MLVLKIFLLGLVALFALPAVVDATTIAWIAQRHAIAAVRIRPDELGRTDIGGACQWLRLALWSQLLDPHCYLLNRRSASPMRSISL